MRASLGTTSHFCEVVVLKSIDALLRGDSLWRVGMLLRVGTLLWGWRLALALAPPWPLKVYAPFEIRVVCERNLDPG